MKDRLLELQVMIQMNDSLEDVQIIIPVIRNRRRRIGSEFLGNFRNDIFDNTNLAATRQSTSVEDFEAVGIRENINLIAQNTEEIKKLHSKILSNSRQKHKAKEKLDEVTIKIENSINIILEKIKLMENGILENIDDISKTQLILSRNIAAILSKKFYEVISNFNEVEKIYQKNLNNQTKSIHAALNHNNKAEIFDYSTKKSFMKEFFVEVEYVRYILKELIVECAEKVKQLQSMMWINPSENLETKNQLEEATFETEHLANAVMEKIKVINNSILYDGGSLSEVEKIIRKNHYNFLSNLFVDVMLNYNISNIDYYERCKKRMRHWFDHTKEHVSDEELDEMSDSGNFKIITFLDEPQYANRLANIEARKKLSGYKSRNDMKRDLQYLKIIIFSINHQMTKSDKSLYQWVIEH